MDFDFIKKEEPVDYALVQTTEDGLWIETDSVTVPNDFNSVDVFTISIKEEATNDRNDDIDSTSATTDYETSEYDPKYEKWDDDSFSGESVDVEDWTSNSKNKNSSKSKVSKRFQCSQCNAVFSKKFRLKEHLAKHKKLSAMYEAMDACTICNKFFPKSTLEFHTILHGAPPYRCRYCTKTFNGKDSFRHHKNVHEEKKWECHICHKYFRAKGTLLSHMETHYEREKTFKCEKCNSFFIRKSTLRRHIRHFHSDVPRKKFKCPNPLCNREYLRSSSLAAHKCAEKTDTSEFYSCSLCDKKFPKKENLRIHMKRVRCDEPKQWRCDKCTVPPFRNLNRLILHTLQNCAKKIMYECDICSMLQSEKCRLVAHFAVVHKIHELRTIPCSNDMCNQMFMSKRRMELHVKAMHSENRCYECQYCFQIFHRKSSYMAHKNRSVNSRCIPKKVVEKYSDNLTDADDLICNQKSQPFECDICGCAFERKIDIIEHITILHSQQLNKKKFNCKMCKNVLRQYQCSNVNHVGDDFGKYHTKTEKCEFKCKKCKIYFSELYALMNHSTRHNEKVHNCFQHMQICKKCNKTFHWKFPIAKHLRPRNKNGYTFMCEFCEKMFKHKRRYITHINKCALS